MPISRDIERTVKAIRKCQEEEPPDMIPVSRAELEKEHSLLIARIHQIRQWLGYPPLLTAKEKRKQTHE